MSPVNGTSYPSHLSHQIDTHDSRNSIPHTNISTHNTRSPARRTCNIHLHNTWIGWASILDVSQRSRKNLLYTTCVCIYAEGCVCGVMLAVLHHLRWVIKFQYFMRRLNTNTPEKLSDLRAVWVDGRLVFGGLFEKSHVCLQISLNLWKYTWELWTVFPVVHLRTTNIKISNHHGVDGEKKCGFFVVIAMENSRGVKYAKACIG